MKVKCMEKARELWKKLGPGLVTGASDDDPSGIAAYSQAGAAFGLCTLWTAFVTYPLMFIIQEMCARIAIINSMGLAGVIKKHYRKPLLYVLTLMMTPAIILNIAADIAGMGAVANLLIPAIPSFVFAFFFTGILVLGMVFFCYERFAAVMKWLCTVLFVYFIVPFLVEQNWKDVLWAAFIPHIEWSKEFFSILVAILGTTISPYLFFWQTSMSVEHQNHISPIGPRKEIKDMKTDVNIGMLLSNLVMFFIILTASSVLYPAGIHHIDTVETAAKALQPLAGEFAYLLFAIGVIGTGLLAIPVLAGCLSYILAEIFDWEKGMDKKAWEAKKFYWTIFISMTLGVLINILNIDPIKSLIYTAILYGMIAPFLIGIILHICNNKYIMGNFTNDKVTNVLGLIALFLMSFAAIVLLFSF